MSNLRDEINKVVRSSPAVVQMYDEASQEGLPVLIDDLVALINKHERKARIDELEKVNEQLIGHNSFRWLDERLAELKEKS